MSPETDEPTEPHEASLSVMDLEFERGGDFDEGTFMAMLHESIDAIEKRGIPYVLMGGLASAALGRPRWTHDIDFFVRPHDAGTALEALAEAGFETQETYPDWLFKGLKHGVLVDVIFQSSGHIYLDDDMIDHAVIGEWKGQKLRLISPEDLLVIKAVVHDEHVPRHWYDGLGLIAAYDLDWEYVLRRARHGARRVLSLLVYAQSVDLIVPEGVIRTLFEAVYGPPKGS
jgi:hypothetical protein